MIQRYFTTSSNCLFCLTVLFVRSLVAEINIVGLTIIFSTWHHQIASSVSLKPEDIQLTVTKDKEKQQICTFERKSASCRLIFCRYSTLQVYFLLTLTGTLWNAAVSNKTVTSLWASILGLQLTISGSVDYFPQTIDQCRKTIKKKWRPQMSTCFLHNSNIFSLLRRKETRNNSHSRKWKSQNLDFKPIN